MWERISPRGIVPKQQQKPRWPPQTRSFSYPTQTSCIRNSKPCGPAFCAQPPCQGVLSTLGEWVTVVSGGAHRWGDCKGIWAGMVKMTSFPRLLLRAGSSAGKGMIPHPLRVVLPSQVLLINDVLAVPVSREIKRYWAAVNVPDTWAWHFWWVIYVILIKHPKRRCVL